MAKCISLFRDHVWVPKYILPVVHIFVPSVGVRWLVTRMTTKAGILLS